MIYNKIKMNFNYIIKNLNRIFNFIIKITFFRNLINLKFKFEIKIYIVII